jgi:hypothetical protein
VSDPYIDHMHGIASLCTLQHTVAQQLHDAVALARADGLTWSDIGSALGMTGPSVWRQFHYNDVINTVKVRQNPETT